MRTHFPVVAMAALAASGALFACTINSTTTNNGPVGDDGGPTSTDSGTTAPDSGSTSDDAAIDAADAATPQAFVRVAQWSPDAPAVDVCFTTAGDTWDGQVPQIAQLVAAADAGALGDGGAAGLTFPQVTSYLVIPPDTYAVRLVAAGSADCSTSVVDLASVPLAANTYTTIAAIGEKAPVQSDQPLKLVAFADDVTAAAGQAGVRFINASPSLISIDVGTGSLSGTGGTFVPLFAGIQFGQTGSAAESDAGTVDANGYLATNAYSGATLSAHVTSSATDTATAANDVNVPASSAATLALVSGVTGGGGAKLLQCADADDSTGTSLLAACTLISQ